MSRLENVSINNIKNLSLDMMFSSEKESVEYYPGLEKIIYSLYKEELKYKRNVPNWINRDRIVFSSPNIENIYSTLFLSGFNITGEDLEVLAVNKKNSVKKIWHRFN